jgi:hypothetical protein
MLLNEGRHHQAAAGDHFQHRLWISFFPLETVEMVPLAHWAEHALVQMNGHEEVVGVGAIGTADATSPWSMSMLCMVRGR